MAGVRSYVCTQTSAFLRHRDPASISFIQWISSVEMEILDEVRLIVYHTHEHTAKHNKNGQKQFCIDRLNGTLMAEWFGFNRQCARFQAPTQWYTSKQCNGSVQLILRRNANDFSRDDLDSMIANERDSTILSLA